MAARFVDIPDSFRDDAATMTNDELEQRYGKSTPTIVRWRRAEKVPSPYVAPGPNGTRSPFSFPPVHTLSYKEPGIVLIEGDCMVTSDWHVPYHDLVLAENMVRLASKLKVKNLAIVGDLFDAQTLSVFDGPDTEFSVRDELASTLGALAHCMKFFDHIYWSIGNHEMRFLRALKFQVTLPDVADFLIRSPKLTTTPLTYMMLDSAGKRFRLEHPKSYSRETSKVASILAQKFGCHVMSAHGHLLGFRHSLDGRYLGIDLGGLFDVSKIIYQNTMGATTHPMANPGFWVVKNGIPSMYANEITDWESVCGSPGGKAA